MAALASIRPASGAKNRSSSMVPSHSPIIPIRASAMLPAVVALMPASSVADLDQCQYPTARNAPSSTPTRNCRLKTTGARTTPSCTRQPSVS
jgi:hypothetical protein